MRDRTLEEARDWFYARLSWCWFVRGGCQVGRIKGAVNGFTAPYRHARLGFFKGTELEKLQLAVKWAWNGLNFGGL